MRPQELFHSVEDSNCKAICEYCSGTITTAVPTSGTAATDVSHRHIDQVCVPEDAEQVAGPRGGTR